MTYRNCRRPAVRRGLTLLELVTVLVILVALAGIVIPLLPDLVGRGETAAGATNQSEISNVIQTYQRNNLKYPEDWDALVDGNQAFMTYVRGGAHVELDGTGLTIDEALALNKAGISRLQLMSAAPEHMTYNPYANADKAANGLAIVSGRKLMMLSIGGQTKLNLSVTTAVSGGKFLVFGFGGRASIVRNGSENAPSAFRNDGNASPDQVYGRFGVIFQVSDAAGVALPKARFLGTCNFTATGIETSEDDLRRFHELTKRGI